MKRVKQLQAIAIAGFWRAKAHMDVHQQQHACFLAASQQCGLFRERHWEPLPRDQFMQGLRAAAMGRAGQERHVFDFPLSLLWLPLSCLLLLPLKVQLLTDQISDLGTSLPLKHNTEIQSLRGLDSGGGLSWTF